jgi:hypothetical protein
MEIGTDVGHGKHSAVPPGLWQWQTVPGVKTPGYCHHVARRRSGKNWVVFDKEGEVLFPSVALFSGRSQQSNINKSLTEK